MKEADGKPEIDLKLEATEQRTQLMFQELRLEFKTVDKDIQWLSKLSMGIFFLLLSLLVGAAFKVWFHF